MELKRLSGLVAAAGTAASYASYAYTAGAAYVPAALKPTVESAEGKVATLATPYVTLLSDKSATALQAVDAKVGRWPPEGAACSRQTLRRSRRLKPGGYPNHVHPVRPNACPMSSLTALLSAAGGQRHRRRLAVLHRQQ